MKNEQAFPVQIKDDENKTVLYSLGLTKREVYAGMAMQGYLATKAIVNADIVARNSVAFADALLAELRRKV